MFLSGYTKRWALTVDATKVPSTQTSMPLYADLSLLPTSFWSTVSNGGGDIRVTEADGITELAREVVSCDTVTNTGELHFLANSVDGVTDTVFYIYANGMSADYLVTDTYGRNAVWSEYELVWHFENNLDDSAGNGHNLINSGSTANPSGTIGAARSFAEGDSASLSALNLSGTNKLTVSSWVKLTGTNKTRVIYELTTNFNSFNDGFGYFQSDSVSSVLSIRGNAGYNISQYPNRISGSNNYIVNVYNKGATALLEGIPYVNGLPQAYTKKITQQKENTNNFGNRPFYLMGRAGSTLFTSGDLDEFRLTTLIRSDAWIKAEYNNQSSPATFYTIGAMEEDSGISVNNRGAILLQW